MQTNPEKENWWNIWFAYVEETARKEGSYHYPLAEKQDTTKGSGFWSNVEFEGDWWWQTIYDANLDHAPVITKKYGGYVDAVKDFSIYPNPITVNFAYQAHFY
jgi:hypothetical protein